MATKREITGAVRLDGRLYRAGDEDELEKVLPKKDAARLEKAGVLSGFGAEKKAEK